MPSGMAIRAGRAFVELFADNSKLVRGLRAARAKVRAFGQRLQNIGTRIAATTAAMAVPVGIAVRTFAGFEDQMAQVRAVTGAADRDFAKLTARAKELGRTTSFTAAQVAGAMTELGRAGFKPGQILDAIGSVLNLARATATDLPRAAEIASAAMRGFGLTAKDTTYIADVLTATANNSAQGLEDIGESMKYVAPMAREAGENIRDTAAALGVLANNGIKGSMAGTALARAYKNLAKTGSQKMLEKMGVNAVDANGNLRKVADILSDLGQATAKMGSAQRLSIFEKLFGRGSAAALKLAGGSNFKNMQTVLSSVGGTAARTARVMDDTLGGSFRKLWSAVEGVQIAIGEALGPVIARLSAWMTKAAGSVTAWLRTNRALLVTITKVVAAVFAAGAALIALGLALKAISAAIGVVIGVIGIAKVAFAAFTTVLGLMLSPIAMVIAAVGALGAYLITATKSGAKALDWLGGKFTRLKNWASEMWTGISDALAAGDIALAAKIMWLGLKMAWTTGIGALERLWVTFTKGFQAAFWTAAKGIAEAMLSVARSAENLWSEFKGGLKAIGAWAEKEVVNATIKLTTDDDKQDAVIAENERTYRKKVMGIKRDMDAEIAKSDAFYDKKKKQVEKNYNSRMVEIGKGVIAATDKIKAAQDAAQAELDAAIAEAKRKRTEHKPDDDKGPEGLAGPEGLQGKVAKLLGDLQSGMSASAGGIAGQLQSVTGTFSAMMLGGLGAGHTNIQERTAKAAEATAKHVKRIDRKTDKGPRFMR